MSPAADNRFDSSRICHRCDQFMRVRPVNDAGQVVPWGKGVRVEWLCGRCYACAEVDEERGAPGSQVGLGL